MCRWVFGVEIGRLPFILYFCAEKMNDMAVKAHDFVVEEKSWEIQGKKIHDFLVEM